MAITPLTPEQLAVLAKVNKDTKGDTSTKLLRLPNPQEPQPLSELWTLRTLADAYQPRPPLQYAVEGLFAFPSLNIVYGAPGAFKSMLLADAALSIAAGVPWLQPLPASSPGVPAQRARAVQQTPVLWIDVDNGQRRTDERFDALGRARNLSPDTPLHYVSMPNPPVILSSPEFTTEVAAFVEQLETRVVVFDNLGLISGAAEENSADMAGVMANLRRIAEQAQAAVIVVHHQRKSSAVNKRKGDTLRGHSSIEASLDLALLVERDPSTNDIRLIATKVRGPDVATFGARFVYTWQEGTKELTSARFFGIQVEDKAEQQTRVLRNAICHALHKLGKASQTTLIDQAKEEASQVLGKDVSKRAIRELILNMTSSSGELIVEKGEYNATLYCLAE